MRICIDSNQFIFGIGGADPASESLLLLLPELEVVLPRLVIKEVTRNLTEAQTRDLFALFTAAPLVRKYVELGLREKADAFIGAFAEWQAVRYLISDNRHFLAELSGAAFEVLPPDIFLKRHAQGKS